MPPASRGATCRYNCGAQDRLVTASGDTATVEGVEILDRTATVYTIEVPGLHTYFVSDERVPVQEPEAWVRRAVNNVRYDPPAVAGPSHGMNKDQEGALNVAPILHFPDWSFAAVSVREFP